MRPRLVCWAALLLVGLLVPPAAAARQKILVGENTRMSFEQEIVRIAVGDPQIANVQMVSNRELLVLGRRTGQTNLLLWYANGRVSERGIRVERDLSLLEAALAAIHPAIEAVSAPDQDAVVLRGVVPDVRFSRAAEAVASDYVRGGTFGRLERRSLILGADGEEAGAGDAGAAVDSTGVEGDFLIEGAAGAGDGRVVNLIQVDDVPPALEERILLAVLPATGGQVGVRRLAAGALPDDTRDTFVLEGWVRTQVDLVRALLAAARMIDERASADQIEVVANEAGSLSGRAGNAGGGSGGGGGSFGGAGSTIGGVAGGGAVRNNLDANIARAKALSLANGRILSFIEVEELPHVRLETRIYEVNRSRLKAWEPNADILIGNTGNTEIIPSATSQLLQGEDGAQSLDANDVQGALSLLGGGLLGGAQYVGGAVAVDLALGLLERTSIARALAKPTISVLSGELATFSAGGSVPIAVSVNTAASDTLLSSTVFADFGVNVSVRPLVDEDDMITLDVTPSISQPDFDLTKELVDSTGAEQNTTAFKSRSLRTTTRLRDGESFVIGGLLQTSIGRASNFTPWFHRIPGLGWLGKSRDDQRDELDFVVVLTPSISHERDPRAGLWSYHTANEILADLIPMDH